MATASNRVLLFWSVFVLFSVQFALAMEYATKVNSTTFNATEDSKRYSRAEDTSFKGVSAFGNDITTTSTVSTSLRITGTFPSFSTLAAELNFIRTLAGTGVKGFSGDGFNATKAQLSSPVDLAVDKAGNIYIADASNNRIRKLTLSTGIISTVVGTGGTVYNGDNIDATSAAINNPEGVGIDGAGNIFIADTENHRIRKVTVSTGKITTIAGTGSLGFGVDGINATLSNLQRPSSVAVDAAGNIYIADTRNHRIRKVSASTGLITTVAGTGTPGFTGDGVIATTARLFNPLAVATDQDGNFYIADTLNHCLRKVTVSTGIITTIAGLGTRGYNGDGIDAKAALLRDPKGVSVDKAGNIFIADSNNYRIRKVLISTGKIVTVAGTGTMGFSGDGVNATSAELNYVAGIVVDGAGNFYIADTNNHRVRSLTGETRSSSPTSAPSLNPAASPNAAPTSDSTPSPSFAPSTDSTLAPSFAPSTDSTLAPSFAPSTDSTLAPSFAPSLDLTVSPSFAPSVDSTPPTSDAPSTDSTPAPTFAPTIEFNPAMSYAPSVEPTPAPSMLPTTFAPDTVFTPSPTVISPTTSAIPSKDSTPSPSIALPAVPSCENLPTRAPRCRPPRKTRRPTRAPKRKNKKRTAAPTIPI